MQSTMKAPPPPKAPPARQACLWLFPTMVLVVILRKATAKPKRAKVGVVQMVDFNKHPGSKGQKNLFSGAVDNA